MKILSFSFFSILKLKKTAVKFFEQLASKLLFSLLKSYLIFNVRTNPFSLSISNIKLRKNEAKMSPSNFIFVAFSRFLCRSHWNYCSILTFFSLQVFLLLVKRLASSLQYSSETVPQNCPKSLVPLNVVRKLAKKICDNDKSRNFQAINNCRPECGATTNRNIPEKSKFDEKYDSVDCNHQERINESIYKKPSDIETDSSKHNNKRDNMGSNVSTAGKGLSERRTQSSSEYLKSKTTSSYCHHKFLFVISMSRWNKNICGNLKAIFFKKQNVVPQYKRDYPEDSLSYCFSRKT